MSRRENLPSPGAVGARLDDLELLRDYVRLGSLGELAEKRGLGNAQEASKAVNRALTKLDKRLLGHAGALRAQEFLRLEEIDADLGRAAYTDQDGVLRGDPKVAAEKRLLSESRRRLYGLDVKGEAEVEAPQINVIFATPAERAADVEIVDSTGEVMDPPALGPGGADEGEPGVEG